MKDALAYLHYIWTSIFIVCLLGCMVIGYAYHMTFGYLWYVPITVYGITMLMHLLFQFIFAGLNRHLVDRVERLYVPDGKPVGVQVVGHREDPKLFCKSLFSLSKLTYKNIKRIVFVSDGDDNEDEYQGEIFKGLFGSEGAIVHLDKPLNEMSRVSRRTILNELVEKHQNKHLCIFQPKRSKREALYTAFAIHKHDRAAYIVTTDSDTELAPDAVTHLVLLFRDPHVGAVTGDVGIYSDHNWLSFLSSLRYWFAFNLERGAQSFFGVVTCVSGPLGAYRRRVLTDRFLDEWVSQEFLGKRATYGDDRHLTNLILKYGHKVVYTHYATCITETPKSVRRWITQQTRWSKSFYREFLLNSSWFDKHPTWLAYDLTYQAVYPFFLVFSIGLQVALYLEYQTLFFLVVWITTILMGGGLRVLYAILNTAQIRYVWFVFYGFIYIAGLLPAKIIGLATLYDVSWGTSPRKHVQHISYWGRLKKALQYLGMHKW